MPEASVPKKTPAKVTQLRTISMSSPGGIKYSVEMVGPKLAEQWLAKNQSNRSLRNAKVDAYARDMSSGDWLENGTAISFDFDGRLLDGQHRLWAITESGATIRTLVVRGLKPKAQDTLDDGTKRTLGDTFGFHGVQNSNAAAAISRRVILWQQGYRTNTGTYQPTKAGAIALLNDDPTVSTAIEQACALANRKLVSPSIIGLTWWLFWGVDESDCAEFWNGLHTGIGLTDTSPIYIVREQIMRQNARAERVPETAFLAWIIKAWNQWRSEKDLSPTYRYSFKPGEKFPEPK